MRYWKKITACVLMLSLMLSTTACNTSGANGESEQTTTTTNEKELDNEIDWDSMSEIDAVDSQNEEGTGSLYVPGQKAGVVKALCYYDLADTEPQLAELLAQRFGGTIETEVTSSGSQYFQKLATLIASGDSPDIVRYDWEAYPGGISKNMYTPLDDWLDMDSPLWSAEKDVIENFNYAGKHYYYPSSIQVNFAIIYNKLVLEEAGLDDPLNLYLAGDWNWNTFEQMLRDWGQQGEDYIGFTGGSWSSMMFTNSTGVKIIDMTGTEIKNNLKDINVQRTMDWLSGLKKLGLIGDGFIDPGEAFLDGKLLFLGMGLVWGYESAQEMTFKNGIESDIGALPFPRDPESDKYYLSSDTFGFLVPSGAKNIQGGVDWILCGRIYETDPEIIAKDRAEKMDTNPKYFAKCPNCKYDFVGNGNDDLSVCPECDTPRKEKYKPYYSEEQLDVIADMINPEKFTFVFDNSVGFGDDLATIFIGAEDSVFDGPIYYASSFTQLRDANYGAVEAYLEPYRDALAEAAAAN